MWLPSSSFYLFHSFPCRQVWPWTWFWPMEYEWSCCVPRLAVLLEGRGCRPVPSTPSSGWEEGVVVRAESAIVDLQMETSWGWKSKKKIRASRLWGHLNRLYCQLALLYWRDINGLCFKSHCYFESHCYCSQTNTPVNKLHLITK